MAPEMLTAMGVEEKGNMTPILDTMPMLSAAATGLKPKAQPRLMTMGVNTAITARLLTSCESSAEMRTMTNQTSVPETLPSRSFRISESHLVHTAGLESVADDKAAEQHAHDAPSNIFLRLCPVHGKDESAAFPVNAAGNDEERHSGKKATPGTLSAPLSAGMPEASAMVGPAIQKNRAASMTTTAMCS